MRAAGSIFCTPHFSDESYAPKRIPNIIDCNLKKDYHFLNSICYNISVIIGHQMTVQVPTSPSVCFCTTWGNQNKQILHLYLK